MKLINTYNQNSTSFQAKYINNANILKRTSKNVFKSLDTSFVEIDPMNINDIKALDKISQYWVDSYAVNMSYVTKAMHEGSLSTNDFKIFALTKQLKDFNNLKSSDILGLVEITPKGKGSIHINYLQTDPEQVYAIEPDYNKIGSRILDSLKNLYNTITLRPIPGGVVKFYEKNEFLPTKENPKVYKWTKY